MAKISVRNQILDFINKKYSVRGDSPWAKYPDLIVLRHGDNKKWFGLVMNIPKNKMGLNGDGMVDVINLKKDNVVIGGFIKQFGILPAYHMNKASWISVLLDGSVPLKDIEFLINVSYELTKSKKRIKS